ncbi:MAG: hypothetical protein OXI67_09845 [Candidatus Poribacteria bacterium]|nr:hypothetical protein [Candidatus Poribacteria bacterium]
MYNTSYTLEIHDLFEFLAVEVLFPVFRMHRQCSTDTADAEALPEYPSDRLVSIITRTDLICLRVIIETSSLYRDSKNGHIPNQRYERHLGVPRLFL